MLDRFASLGDRLLARIVPGVTAKAYTCRTVYIPTTQYCWYRRCCEGNYCWRMSCP